MMLHGAITATCSEPAKIPPPRGCPRNLMVAPVPVELFTTGELTAIARSIHQARLITRSRRSGAKCEVGRAGRLARLQIKSQS